MDKCGEERAKSAYLSEREQAADEMLIKQHKEWSQGRALANRDETLARPEYERVQEHTRNDRLSHDRGDRGFTR